MKRYFIFLFICVGIFTFYLVEYIQKPNKIEGDVLNPDEIKSHIKSGAVYGEITDDCYCYKESSLENKLGTLKKESIVEILQDKNTEVYEIKTSDNKKAWVSNECLYIKEDDKTNNIRLEDNILEEYVKLTNLSSKTDYLVWVDIDRQRTYIFKKNGNDFKILKRIVCATGRNQSPTTRGIFEISDRGEWFYSERLQSGAKFWVRFNGSYLFHSVAMDKNQNIIDPIVGERRSSGCVRMRIDDIEWFYNNIPRYTTVYVY